MAMSELALTTLFDGAAVSPPKRLARITPAVSMRVSYFGDICAGDADWESNSAVDAFDALLDRLAGNEVDFVAAGDTNIDSGAVHACDVEDDDLVVSGANVSF